jgi:hypothetical protein
MDWIGILILSAAAGVANVADTVRLSVVIDQQAQDEALAQILAEGPRRDEAVWLDADAKRGLVVRRRAQQGEIQGSVIVLAEPERGPGGITHAVQIRRGLALHGWHTYFARLPHADHEQTLQALVRLVRGRGAEGALVVITEGATTHWAASAVGSIAVDGLVLINVPQSSAEFPAAVTLLGALTLPSLVLQEYPYDWHKEDPLGDDVELHLLPPGDARREDNRLIRKIRGWFKRRFASA